jgi:hypothetical protein
VPEAELEIGSQAAANSHGTIGVKPKRRPDFSWKKKDRRAFSHVWEIHDCRTFDIAIAVLHKK